MALFTFLKCTSRNKAVNLLIIPALPFFWEFGLGWIIAVSLPSWLIIKIVRSSRTATECADAIKLCELFIRYAETEPGPNVDLTVLRSIYKPRSVDHTWFIPHFVGEKAFSAKDEYGNPLFSEEEISFLKGADKLKSAPEAYSRCVEMLEASNFVIGDQEIDRTDDSDASYKYSCSAFPYNEYQTLIRQKSTIPPTGINLYAEENLGFVFGCLAAIPHVSVRVMLFGDIYFDAGFFHETMFKVYAERYLPADVLQWMQNNKNCLKREDRKTFGDYLLNFEYHHTYNQSANKEELMKAIDANICKGFNYVKTYNNLAIELDRGENYIGMGGFGRHYSIKK